MSYRPEDFYAGQRVRIRDWDDMAEEYGPDHLDYIDTPYYCFLAAMEPACGATAIVNNIIELGDDNACAAVELEIVEDRNGASATEESLVGGGAPYYYTTDMLEPLEDFEAIKASFDIGMFHNMLCC